MFNVNYIECPQHPHKYTHWSKKHGPIMYSQTCIQRALMGTWKCVFMYSYIISMGVKIVLSTYSEILFWLRATKSVLTPLYYVLRREEIFYNFIVFGLTRSVLESMIYFTRRNMINAVTFFSFEVDGTYCSAAK